MSQDEKPPKPIYVYVLTDPRTGDVRYVGVTNNPKSRFSKHMHNAKVSSNHRANWISSLVRDGLKPIMTIIDETNNENWQQCEIAWIAYYRGLGCNLVNSTDGGEGSRGIIRSEEYRRKISESQRGERHNMYGKHHSEESRRKNSEAHLGKRHSEQSRKRMSEARAGEKHYMYGKRHSEKTRKKMSEVSGKKRSVLQYDKFGHFVKQWDRATVASEETKICLQNIIACCCGGRKSAGGYIWRYADDPILGIPPTQLKLDFE